MCVYEHAVHRTLLMMGYPQQRPLQVPMLSTSATTNQMDTLPSPLVVSDTVFIISMGPRESYSRGILLVTCIARRRQPSDRSVTLWRIFTCPSMSPVELGQETSVTAFGSRTSHHDDHGSLRQWHFPAE